MKNRKSYFSTVVKSIFALALISTLSFGCEKEVIQPESDVLSLQANSYNHIERPTTQCGTTLSQSLADGASVFGSLEILNNNTDLYLIFNLNQGKFLEEVKIYTGDQANLAVDSDGNIQQELFGFQQILSSPTNDYTLTLPLSSMTACPDFVVRAQVSTRNMFGQVTATNMVWMSGTPIFNGFFNSFCIQHCMSSNLTPLDL